ncbi:homoserine kinase [Lentibacillus kapialis]|uniref:Homoserine kinase n=1 Tax=Lentibacillus kapialis TaxID=340214 RepID=A0A917UVR2_9BACI|nr:homoserine kinase [Lentibacillus kapialis]GGJ88733.1 homoserine kinase [Lentibacillus kapialis]
MKPFRVRVPASSANIGPGFDSMGLALNLYLTLDISPSDKWEIVQHSPHLPILTNAEDHFIVQIAHDVAARWHAELPACKMAVYSDIPLARGLGSSASAIVAGIELAVKACHLPLTPEEKLELATEIEGHPDNIAPTLMGGFVISTVTAGEIDWIQLPVPEVDVIVYIPEEDLTTESARQVLPETYKREDAATASALSNVLIAALASDDLELAGKMMERDMFHEPYRAKLISGYEDIKREAKEAGAYGTVISGSGPTMISFAPKGKGQTIADRLSNLMTDHNVALLEIDYGGAVTTSERLR